MEPRFRFKSDLHPWLHEPSQHTTPANIKFKDSCLCGQTVTETLGFQHLDIEPRSARQVRTDFAGTYPGGGRILSRLRGMLPLFACVRMCATAVLKWTAFGSGCWRKAKA